MFTPHVSPATDTPIFNYWSAMVSALKLRGCRLLPDDHTLGKIYAKCMAASDPRAEMEKLFRQWDDAPRTSTEMTARMERDHFENRDPALSIADSERRKFAMTSGGHRMEQNFSADEMNLGAAVSDALAALDGRS
jgi:hypothetical protein